MRLGVKVVEEGECLKSWIRFGGIRAGSEGRTENLEAAQVGMASKASIYYYDSK